jgi:hypothetical protein
MRISPLDPAAVLAAFGLDGPATSMTEVGGAWSSRVFRLEAGSGVFAVKEMRNPWRIPHWEEWRAQAWAFELSAIGAGVVAREVVRAYHAGGGDDTDIAPGGLGQPMMSSVDWIAMNADRALGQWPASAAEVIQAGELLPGLLTALPAQVAAAMRIAELLRI